MVGRPSAAEIRHVTNLVVPMTGLSEVGKPPLSLVDEVISDQRDDERHECRDDNPQLGRAVRGAAHSVASEDGVENVEAGVLEVGEQPDEERPDVPELRARLDHLRQAQLWSLRRVKRHEQRADQHADHDGQHRPEQRRTLTDADQPDCQGGNLRIRHEPQRAEMPHLAMPFGQRHVVDRADLDPACPGLRGSHRDTVTRLRRQRNRPRPAAASPGAGQSVASSSSQCWLARATRGGTPSSSSISLAAAISWARRRACW